MKTYQVSAENLVVPYVTYAVNGVNIHTAMSLATVLSSAFRSVRIEDEETGEVVYNVYYAEDLYAPFVPVTTAIESANDVYNTYR